jgi:uncharacterized repeat protein (TIGR02543 family)
MKDYYRTYLGSIEISSFAFDSGGSTSYDPLSATNIAHRLNNEFYNSLDSEDSALILSHNWLTGTQGHEPDSAVNCKIGMLSMTQAGSAYSPSNILGSISGNWWTLTPGDSGGVNLRNSSGGIGGTIDATYSEMVRPALYLPVLTWVSGGNGGTVLGGSHNIPAVTGISPAEGSSQGGTEVTVSGTGLSEATEVYFGSTAGTITSASDTSITVTAPGGAGVVDITVTNPYGTSPTSSADQFRYVSTQATPAFSPAAGEVAFGTDLQIISTGADHIYYTTDGTDPSTSSTEYNDAVRPVINSAMTVKAIATASGKADSIVASASYTQAASADLTDIVISGAPGNFIFTPDQYTYNGLTVASGVETVTVTPTGAGVITVNGTEVASGHASADIALTGGVEENITVVATETGKSPKAYSIKITRAQPVASITKNGAPTNYDTLSAALAAAQNDTVTLLRDVTESVVLAATTDNTITIDGQGHTITGEAAAGQSSVALTLSGDGNVILKDLTLQGGGAPNDDSSGLLVSGGSVNALCEGTVNAYGANSSQVSSGLIHRGSGAVNITSATGGSSAQFASYGVQNTGAGTVNVANAAAGGNIPSGISYGVDNSGAGTVNVTNASGSSARQSMGVNNRDTGSVNVASAAGGAATYYSFGVNNTQSGGSVNVANASMVPGGTYGNEINGVAVNMDVTTLTLNRGSGESCVLDTITIASAGSTRIGILPGVLKDGVVYSWYEDSARTDLFSGTTVTGTANLYSGLPSVPNSIIDISEISGVTVPVTGSAPTSAVADTTEYTATISWSPAASAFAAGTVYTATITLIPKTGYTLTGVPANFFTVSGATATNAAGSGIVTAVFPKTGRTVGSLASDIEAVGGLTASVNGNTVTVTGTAAITSTSDAGVTFEIPSGVTVVWKASLSGGGKKYLLAPTGDGTFEVADGANIVNDACQTAIYCYDGKGNLNVTGGNVSTTGLGMAIGVAGDWLLTMTGGKVAADEADSCAIFGKNSVVITGGTVSATGTDGYQLGMSATSVYRGGIIDPGKIKCLQNSSTFTEVCIGAAVTQAVSGTSIGLTVTGRNLEGHSVTAVWGKQNGKSGVVVSYYSDKNPTAADDTEFFAVPGVTVSAACTVTFNKNGGDTEASPATKIVASGGTVDALPTEPTRSGYTFTGWNTAADGSGAAFTVLEIVKSDITLYAQWSKKNDTVTSDDSSDSSTKTTTTTITVTAPVTTVNGSTAITPATAAIGSDGKATASVTQSQMSDALAKAKAAAGTGGTPNVQIQVSGASGASSVGTTIPHASLQALASGGIGALTISGPTGSVSFDAAALKTISGASGDVTVTVAKTDSSKLSDAAKAVVGSHPVFTFSVTSGGNAISQFGGNVTVSVPYTPASGEDTNAIVLYYIVADGTPTLAPDARYDAATGTVVFTTTHFSTYAVGYNKVSFTDVSSTAWYANAVTFLAARGITSGTTATTFGPDATLTRGQFITMLLRAYGVSAVTNPTDNFSDAGSTYYTGYLAAAKKLGITTGVGGNKFAPEKAITRQEMFTLLYNALKVLGKLPSGTSGKTLSGFADAGSIASWAQNAMTTLVKTGTVTGSGGKLNPTGATTRAEMAQVLYNLLRK